VLINLLSNAIKYNRPNGKVVLSVKIIDDRVHIAVRDTGRGIPLELQSRLFTSFDRLGAEMSSIEGAGVGLVITKRMTEAMKGRLGFESTEGQGSIFWVDFPLCNPRAVPTAPSPQHLPKEPDGDKPIVLYIEDSQINVRLMSHIFSKLPELELRDAHTAEMGIDIARNQATTLILMDINLPGIDGYTALKLLKNHPRTAHIPVIAVSANVMAGDAERGLAAGFVAYIAKPFDIPNFYKTLAQIMQLDFQIAQSSTNKQR